MNLFSKIFGTSNTCNCEKQIKALQDEINGFNHRVNANTHNIAKNREAINELKSPLERETINLDDVELENYSYPTTYSSYLSPRVNRYGNTVTRISDHNAFNTTSNRLGNDYSQVQSWNCDETLIKLAGKPAFIIDAQTFEPIKTINQQGDPRWSNIHPNIIYGVSDNSFVKLDVNTNQRTTIKNFSNYIRITLTSQGNLSNDDKIVLLVGQKSNGQYLIVYDLENNTILKEKQMNLSNLDWCSISPKGDYCLLSYNADGLGTRQGMKRLDLNLENETALVNANAHNDYGLDADGSQVIVHIRMNDEIEEGYALAKTNIETGEQTLLFEWKHSEKGSWGIYGAHISMRSNVKGWAVISEGCCPNHPCLPREIFAIKLDGSNEIIRIAKHHTDHRAGYYHEAHASVNRSFNQVIFKSNENKQQYKNYESAHAFVVDF